MRSLLLSLLVAAATVGSACGEEHAETGQRLELAVAHDGEVAHFAAEH